MNCWIETQTKLDQALALERQFAQRRRQHQWQQLARQGKELVSWLVSSLVSTGSTNELTNQPTN